MERKISGISEFPEKKDNLESLTEIFEKIFRKFSVPFEFEPEFSEILVEWKAPLVAPRSRQNRDKEISSQEDIRNLTTKDLREILRYHSVFPAFASLFVN